jgi:hypothetical protein
VAKGEFFSSKLFHVFQNNFSSSPKFLPFQR